MGSWVYLFSKFTPEALLFEALLICTLCAAYAAFWVLHKRKVGTLQNGIPTNVIKGYLNALIGDAESLRAQLFGLLSASGVPSGDLSRFAQSLNSNNSGVGAPTGSAAFSGGLDATSLQKMASLETQMAEQARAMETIIIDKVRIEKELADARAAGGGSKGAASATVDQGELSKLQDKIKNLEGKLSEYSVIEDDLANLKRLQQENTQLRAALAGQGGALPVSAAAAAAPPRAAVSEPTSGATSVDPMEAAATAEAPASSADATPNPFDDVMSSLGSETELTPEAPAAPEASFEGLVDQVEQSIQEVKTSTPPASVTEEAVVPVPSPPAAAASSADQSDADLVAEFEKMLNS